MCMHHSMCAAARKACTSLEPCTKSGLLGSAVLHAAGSHAWPHCAPAGNTPEGASASDVSGWSSDQLITFLEKLAELRALQPLHASTSQALAALYGLLATKNAEIRSAYYKLAIAAEDTQALEPCVELLQTQVGGRRPVWGWELAVCRCTAEMRVRHSCLCTPLVHGLRPCIMDVRPSCHMKPRAPSWGSGPAACCQALRSAAS